MVVVGGCCWRLLAVVVVVVVVARVAVAVAIVAAMLVLCVVVGGTGVGAVSIPVVIWPVLPEAGLSVRLSVGGVRLFWCVLIVVFAMDWLMMRGGLS